MDFGNMTPLLGFGIILTIISVSGLAVPSIEDLSVSISDEKVVLSWKHPAGDSTNVTYNVQMAKYVGEWKNVSECRGISHTQCDLTAYVEDYRTIYKVRVQTVRNNRVSKWTAKKVTPYESKLSPPSFNVWASSSTLIIYVLPKPVLRKLFPYGVTYTIHLMERGQDDKNITGYLKDADGNGQTVKTFSSLQWGVEYCVSVKVEGNGGRGGSIFSPQHCQWLPNQEWFVIAVSSLTTAGVLLLVIIVVLGLQCYLKRPHQTPAALKSPVSGWRPLSVAEARIEVVMDKGWFLSGNSTEIKSTCDLERLPVEKTEGGDEELRRRSLDSGVCMESNYSADKRRQEDSGYDSSTSSETVYPLPGETDTEPRNGGVHALKTEVSYCSQKPSSHNCKQVPDSLLAKVVSGYRSEPQVCLCFGAGRCSWCLKQLHEMNSCNKTQSWQEEQILTIWESLPLLRSLCTQKDLNMNDTSLSICDVLLTTDC